MKTIKTNKKLTWCRISQQWDFPVSDLKKKKNSLTAAFRGHLEEEIRELDQQMYTNQCGLLTSSWFLAPVCKYTIIVIIILVSVKKFALLNQNCHL